MQRTPRKRLGCKSGVSRAGSLSRSVRPHHALMTIETLIERWFAIGSLIFGLSHVLYPAKWAVLFLPHQITVPCGTMPFLGMMTMPSRM